MSFIHFMSLKLIKTTQKCLIFWNLLGVLINKVLIKKSKFILHSFYFLQMFRNHPKMFAIFKLIRQFLLIKVPRKIEIIGVKCYCLNISVVLRETSIEKFTFLGCCFSRNFNCDFLRNNAFYVFQYNNLPYNATLQQRRNTESN